jgi:hypothetical protein
MGRLASSIGKTCSLSNYDRRPDKLPLSCNASHPSKVGCQRRWFIVNSHVITGPDLNPIKWRWMQIGSLMRPNEKEISDR